VNILKSKIDNIVWILPRPRKDKYRGGFPLHFEKKLLRLYNHPEKILHTFGGKAEHGIRIDLKKEVDPDIVGDAHNLPIKDDYFDIVILDPPYSDEYSKEMYNTGPVHLEKAMREAVRVTKIGGRIVLYHIYLWHTLKGTILERRIFIGTRIYHLPRIASIYVKRRSYSLKDYI